MCYFLKLNTKIDEIEEKNRVGTILNVEDVMNALVDEPKKICRSHMLELSHFIDMAKN